MEVGIRTPTIEEVSKKGICRLAGPRSSQGINSIFLLTTSSKVLPRYFSPSSRRLLYLMSSILIYSDKIA